MAPTTTNQKLKTFPEPIIISDSEEESSDAIGNGLGDEIGGSDSDDMSDDESESDDAPEAESLRGGKAAADARDDALKKHEQRLNELRKTKNKAREAFIQSTKSEVPASVENQVDPITDAARDMEEDEPVEEAPRSNRLPDSIFAAAHETVERKSSKKLSKNDVLLKRKRVRQTPKEKVINGRTLRVTMDLDAPPAASSSSSTRKVKNSTKGGLAFRKKWKKVDALRAQVRSRTGPPRNFVTVVQ